MTQTLEHSESTTKLWQECLDQVANCIDNQDDFHQLIAPLQMVESNQGVVVYAPNSFIFDRVRENYSSCD